MGGEERPPANRMSLGQFKARLIGAKKGHGLLKKKRDALKARFMEMLKDIVATKKGVADGMKEASFSYAKAQYAGGSGDVGAAVLERAKMPSVTATLKADNVAGVHLPSFKFNYDPSKDSNVHTLGIAQGGAVLQRSRETHLKTLELIIKMASLQTSFVTLDEEIKMTGRRVNALEYVIIPRIEGVMAEIVQELDEQARDDFIRVKKVVQKKKEKLAREAADTAKYEAEKASRGVAVPKAAPAAAAPSMIAGKDPDVMF